MGGGGGGSYSNWKSDHLAREVRKDAERLSQEYEAALAGYFSDLLATFNDRDAELVRARLDTIKEALKNDLETSFDQVFGGSVAKHTYVDGLSDIDSLLVVNGSGLEGRKPESVLKRITGILREHLGDEATITFGSMAVTLEYGDGMQIQLLPAIRTESGLRIPAAKSSGWAEINPERFQKALIKRNSDCGGKLVPTIKLAKAIISTLPEKYRLSGYHVESLALQGFEGYTGEKTTTAMLPCFFERAKDLVLHPIRDRSGQSDHVDEYLGPDDGSVRREISHVFGGIVKRMRTASAAKSHAQWAALFDNE